MQLWRAAEHVGLYNTGHILRGPLFPYICQSLLMVYSFHTNTENSPTPNIYELRPPTYKFWGTFNVSGRVTWRTSECSLSMKEITLSVLRCSEHMLLPPNGTSNLHWPSESLSNLCGCWTPSSSQAYPFFPIKFFCSPKQ